MQVVSRVPPLPSSPSEAQLSESQGWRDERRGECDTTSIRGRGAGKGKTGTSGMMLILNQVECVVKYFPNQLTNSPSHSFRTSTGLLALRLSTHSDDRDARDVILAFCSSSRSARCPFFLLIQCFHNHHGRSNSRGCDDRLEDKPKTDIDHG